MSDAFDWLSVPPWWNCFMAIVKLKIDVSGTVGDEAWRGLRQFEQTESRDKNQNQADDAPFDSSRYRLFFQSLFKSASQQKRKRRQHRQDITDQLGLRK